MKKNILVVLLATLLAATGCANAQKQRKASAASEPEAAAATLPKVYFFKEISSDNLVKIYEALGREAKGKVAVKLSTGEPGGHNFLQPSLIKALVQKVNGTIVECNTAYGGGRADTKSHLKAAADHGFTAIAPVVIMDAEGEVELPVEGGKHLKFDIVGKDFLNYDFTIILSHFKGHAMGGFGGAIKNMSIGIASSNGKAGFTRPARRAFRPRRGRTCPSRTTSWSRWPRRPRPWRTIAATGFSTSAWPTTSRWTATVTPRPRSRAWATSASSPRSTP